MRSISKYWIAGIAACLMLACGNQNEESHEPEHKSSHRDYSLPQVPEGKGALFIIGGGRRSPAMLQELTALMPLNKDLILVLPMASSQPDTAAYYGIRQFIDLGYSNVHAFIPDSAESNAGQLDSISNAGLVYLTGGDQNRLMNALNEEVREVLKSYFKAGGVIAGTSAGAAVMSQVMITGDQGREPEYESTYSRLMTENGVYAEGLGLLPNAIVDQHFVERSRYNRALTALHDHEIPVFGIGESTALLVRENSYEVVGEGQVVVLYPDTTWSDEKGRIGMENVRLDVWLPGYSSDKN